MELRGAPTKFSNRWLCKRDAFKYSDLIPGASPFAKQLFTVGDHDRAGAFSRSSESYLQQQEGE
jgi:hypothetical protein